MAKLEYIYHYKQPVKPELAAIAEIILRANSVMTQYIKTQFENSADPPTLRELSADPFGSKDEAHGVPDVYYMIVKSVKQAFLDE